MRISKLVLTLTAIFCVVFLTGGGASADYATKLTLTIADSSGQFTLTSTDYQLIVPATLAIEHSGWTEFPDGITAKVSGDNALFASDYKLSVTATHDSFAATGITETVAYRLKTTSADTEETLAWEFSADELNASKDNVITGTTRTLGVDVDDYTGKPAGDYESTITFTAEVVQDAVTLTSRTVRVDGSDPKTIYYVAGETWAQAIANHPTENSGWSTTQETDGASTWTVIRYSGVSGVVAYADASTEYETYELYADTTIDATSDYYFFNVDGMYN